MGVGWFSLALVGVFSLALVGVGRESRLFIFGVQLGVGWGAASGRAVGASAREKQPAPGRPPTTVSHPSPTPFSH